MGGTAELCSGDVFAGRYEIKRQLGEGDRKRTYLAKDTKLDRLVAIALIKPEAVLADPDGTEREAKVLGRIGSHPSIVSIYDYEIGADGALEYIVFEYLSGGTLGEYLQRTGPQPLENLMRIGEEIAAGLSHLHACGLVHRDVSPDNVWLDDRQVARLGDFDSAILIASSDALRPITTGSFASPEEYEGGLIDSRSDLFSLGGVLLVAATGDFRPGDPAILAAKRPDLPSAFCDLVMTLLAKTPDDRLSNAELVIQRLNEIRRLSDIDALIAAGESDKVEFKSSLHHPYQEHPGLEAKELQKRLNWSVTKTVAAFLNSYGGTLLIGVSDTGTVLGIEPDFEHLRSKPSADGWMQSLQQAITNAFGLEVWSVLDVSLVPSAERTVVVIHCPQRAAETWHKEDSLERFYIRTSNATRELLGSQIVGYIREHWPRLS